MSSLAYQIAERHVEQFTGFPGESEFAQHDEAMDCHNCESYLQLGIDAFRWLVRADVNLHKAESCGAIEYDEEVHKALDSLFARWLEPCARANQWIDIQHKRGYRVENLKEFRKCEEEVTAIIKSWSDRSLTDAMAELRDQAVAEYRDGKTAEFI